MLRDTLEALFGVDNQNWCDHIVTGCMVGLALPLLPLFLPLYALLGGLGWLSSKIAKRIAHGRDTGWKVLQYPEPRRGYNPPPVENVVKPPSPPLAPQLEPLPEAPLLLLSQIETLKSLARPYCAQCGREWKEPACGISHACALAALTYEYGKEST